MRFVVSRPFAGRKVKGWGSELDCEAGCTDAHYSVALLQDVAREVLVFDDCGDHLLYVGVVDDEDFFWA